MSIKQQASFGVKWVSISIILIRLSRFLTSIVLARILLPEHFGIIALANSIIEGLGVVRQLGFGSAFIYKQEITAHGKKVLADTTFFLGFVINFAILFIGVFSAKTISNFFGAEEIKIVLMALFASFAIDAFITVPNLLLQKELQFGKHAFAEICQGISYLIIGISAALMNLQVWSLVFAQIGSRIVFGILLIVLTKWRFHFMFSLAVAIELLSYGKYIWAYVVTGTLGNMIDKMVLGRFWGTIALGYYSIAFNLINIPMGIISFLIDRISFPFFSRMKNERQKIRTAFIEILSMVSIVSFPIFIGLILIADPFIIVVYGSNWKPVIPMIKIFVFYGIAMTFSSITSPIFKALGKPKYVFYTNLFHQIILIFLLYIFKNNGPIGICYAVAAPALITFLILFYLTAKIINLRMRDISKAMLGPLSAGLVMFATVSIFNILSSKYFEMNLKVMLSFNIFSGAISYLLTSLIVNRSNQIKFFINFLGVIKSK